jgi:hypothetical protein
MSVTDWMTCKQFHTISNNCKNVCYNLDFFKLFQFVYDHVKLVKKDQLNLKPCTNDNYIFQKSYSFQKRLRTYC